MDRQLVVVDPLTERGGLDLRTLIGVDLGGRPSDTPQLGEDRAPVEHLLDGIGAQEVVVDLVKAVRVGARITAGPLLSIADRPHALEVDPRDEEGRIARLDEVGEGEIRQVGVRGVTPHDEREGTDTCGPEDVGVGRGLRTALHDTLMDGPELVHVVALIRSRASVHEGELAGDK